MDELAFLVRGDYGAAAACEEHSCSCAEEQDEVWLGVVEGSEEAEFVGATAVEFAFCCKS